MTLLRKIKETLGLAPKELEIKYLPFTEEDNARLARMRKTARQRMKISVNGGPAEILTLVRITPTRFYQIERDIIAMLFANAGAPESERLSPSAIIQSVHLEYRVDLRSVAKIFENTLNRLSA